MDNDWFKLAMAAVIAGLGAAFIALDDDSVSSSEWVAIALAVFTALAGTEAYTRRRRAKKAEAAAKKDAA